MTPGVAAAPVALAAIACALRSMLTLWLQAEAFGVGDIAIAAKSAVLLVGAKMPAWIVPTAGGSGTDGTNSGSAAPLLVVPPEDALQLLVSVELPSTGDNDTVPMALPCSDTPIGLPIGLGIVDIPLGVEAVVPDAAEQVTTVPGVVGSCASGTGASVVTGAVACASDVNGLGPLSGDDTMTPGVVGRPIAVVPMVET
jgi:hypothetical protein